MNEILSRSPHGDCAERGYVSSDWAPPLVAALYAILLLAAPAIVRYAPAPSATPIGVTAAPEAHHDCAAATSAPACARTTPR